MRFTLVFACACLAAVSGCVQAPEPSSAADHPHAHAHAHAHDHNHGSGVLVEELVRSTQSWNGATLPAYPEGQPEVVVLRVTVPPHTSLPWHEHPVINAGVLTKGTLLVMTPDGSTKRLHAGDALIELVDQPHRGVNDSDEPAEVFVVYAGTTGEPITVPTDVER
ncbi:MAG: cupin domain-containing protein [Planctomycetota bacterium]